MSAYNAFWARFLSETDTDKKIAMRDEYLKLDETINTLANFDQTNSQIVKLLFTVMIWLFILRFKRVEVQVVQDARATTYSIFKKITFTRQFNAAFLAILIVSYISLLVYYDVTLFKISNSDMNESEREG